MLWPANGILSDVVGMALPVEFTSQTVRTNVHGTNLAYRRRKSEGREEPASKHQIRSGNESWAGRGEAGRLKPSRETKIQGENGDRERGIREEEVTEKRKFLARKRRRRGRAERRLL